ncbi:hypothetical protein Tco_1045966 [Tanacetum coccineum]
MKSQVERCNTVNQETKSVNESLTNELERYKEKVKLWKKDKILKTHKTSLGYQNPLYLRQAQRKQPVLYSGKALVEKHDSISVCDSEETLILAEESQLKMKDKQKEHNDKPIDYSKLNKLYEYFVPQKQLSAEQVYWSPVSKTTPPVNVTKPIPTQVFPKKLPTTSKAHANLQNAKDIFDKFKACIKKRTVLSGVEVRNWRVMHIKGAFEQDVTPFLKNLKEAYKHFEMGLYKEVHEMKGVLCGCYPELQKAKMACSTATFVKFRISYKYADLRRVWIFKFPPSNEIWEQWRTAAPPELSSEINTTMDPQGPGRVWAAITRRILTRSSHSVEKVGSFWTALKALSRKEVHYGSNARTDSESKRHSSVNLRRTLILDNVKL